MSFSISGKTAIVTGGANGIGLAIGRHFVDKGANVDVRRHGRKAADPRIGREFGRWELPVRYFAGDLREKLTLANLLSATIDAFDQVDILVNASRQVVLSDPLNPDDDTGWRCCCRQNMLTALRLSQLVAKRMIKQSEGEGSTASPEPSSTCRRSPRGARIAGAFGLFGGGGGDGSDDAQPGGGACAAPDQSERRWRLDRS